MSIIPPQNPDINEHTGKPGWVKHIETVFGGAPITRWQYIGPPNGAGPFDDPGDYHWDYYYNIWIPNEHIAPSDSIDDSTGIRHDIPSGPDHGHSGGLSPSDPFPPSNPLPTGNPDTTPPHVDPPVTVDPREGTSNQPWSGAPGWNMPINTNTSGIWKPLAWPMSKREQALYAGTHYRRRRWYRRNFRRFY